MSDRRPPVVAAFAALFLHAAAAMAAPAPAPSGWLDAVGRLHPPLVHFPLALIVTALAAEAIFVARRDERYAAAARFMIHAGAWVGIAAALTGLARAGSITLAPDQAPAFAVHRIAGIATPVLAFLAAALADGVRRSGQIWELFLYRIALVVAAAAAVLAGYHGGEIVFGAGFFSLW
jgi:uncharacterized membrane protein